MTPALQNVVQKFLPLSLVAANKLGDNNVAENRTVAAALALLAGFQGGDHAAISLLSGRIGMVTLQVLAGQAGESLSPDLNPPGQRGQKDFQSVPGIPRLHRYAESLVPRSPVDGREDCQGE